MFCFLANATLADVGSPEHGSREGYSQEGGRNHESKAIGEAKTKEIMAKESKENAQKPMGTDIINCVSSAAMAAYVCHEAAQPELIMSFNDRIGPKDKTECKDKIHDFVVNCNFMALNTYGVDRNVVMQSFTTHLSLDDLVKYVESRPKDKLAFVIQTMDIPTLANALIHIDGRTLQNVVNVIDANTYRTGYAAVDSDTKKAMTARRSYPRGIGGW